MKYYIFLEIKEYLKNVEVMLLKGYRVFLKGILLVKLKRYWMLKIIIMRMYYDILNKNKFIFLNWFLKEREKGIGEIFIFFLFLEIS